MWKLIKRIYAKLNGYFWLPCPLCHDMFGGFEASNTSLWYKVIWDEKHEFPIGTKGHTVCRKCAKKAQEINYQKYHITIKSS